MTPGRTIEKWRLAGVEPTTSWFVVIIVLFHSNELNRQSAEVAESNVERRRERQLEHAGVRARRNDLTGLQTVAARREKIREPY